MKTEKTADATNYIFEQTYDIMGRGTSLKYPDGEIVGYGYDPSGNLGQVIGYATYSNFNALGQPIYLMYGNGVNTNYGYYSSTHSRLQGIITTRGSLTLQSVSYGYDNRGNITQIFNFLDPSRTQQFTYDELNRLKTASTSYDSFSYNYDLIGNITLKEGVTYTLYPGKAHAIGSTTSGRTYTYDNNGNPTSDGTRTFTYTYDNMPRSINGSAIGFLYDGMGNRAKKTTPNYSIIYIDKLYERTTTGGTTSDGKYIFAGNQRIALKTAAQTLYYHPDHLGSTAVVTDATGAKAEEITYYPYGETRSDTGTSNLDHKYTGQELDGEVGLYNYGARLYDPEIGKFITPDTIIPDPSNPQSLNRYSYVLNNPILYTDPNGRFPWAAVAIGVLVGAVSAGIDSNWDLGTMLVGGTIGGISGGVGGYMGGLYNGFVGGMSAGATAGILSSAYYGGNIMDGMYKGAMIGGIGGAAFEGIGAAYGNNWGWGRVALSGLAGGGLAELGGGRFEYGFAMAGGAALAMKGWQGMRDWTNASSLKGSGTPVYDEDGELLTTGKRICDGCTPENTNGFTNAGGYEGDEGWIYRSKPINLVSKVHDFGLGWSYRGTGNFVAGGLSYNMGVAAYSYVTMPLAAIYTGFAFSAQYFQPVIYNFRR